MDDENLKRELSEIMNTNGIDEDNPLAEYLAAYLIDCLESFKKLDDANRLDWKCELEI
jgi:hypothetical protein